MYLIGVLTRRYGFMQDAPMDEIKIIEVMTKDILLRASRDDEYQVIDLIQKKYFDPKTNNWIQIKLQS